MLRLENYAVEGVLVSRLARDLLMERLLFFLAISIIS